MKYSFFAILFTVTLLLSSQANATNVEIDNLIGMKRNIVELDNLNGMHSDALREEAGEFYSQGGSSEDSPCEFVLKNQPKLQNGNITIDGNFICTDDGTEISVYLAGNASDFFVKSQTFPPVINGLQLSLIKANESKSGFDIVLEGNFTQGRTARKLVYSRLNKHD